MCFVGNVLSEGKKKFVECRCKYYLNGCSGGDYIVKKAKKKKKVKP